MEWTMDDLECWYKKIEGVALKYGLDFYPNEIEICTSRDIVGYMAYHGLLAHYPHWSFGKRYEFTQTMYDYGVMGLPYEMVINSNPCIAYLSENNSLLMQILTIAHACFGHNDFFKNNVFFSKTRPELMVELSKARADRVRKYIEDPSIGPQRVEEIIDAAHALAFQRSRNILAKKLTHKEQKDKKLEEFQKERGEFYSLSKPKNVFPPNLDKIPLEPTENILSFLAGFSRNLKDWERDLMDIVDQETEYFLPQAETKIMNEGWASFWHYRILKELDLSQGMHFEFLKAHSSVVCPVVGKINPYYLGYRIFEDIEKRWDNPSDEEKADYGRTGGRGLEKIFQVRATDRDSSFLRQYLTRELIEDLNLVQLSPHQDGHVVSESADEDGWKKIKETLIENVGLNTVPVIKIVDASLTGQNILMLEHEYDGRELDQEYMFPTLKHLKRLWNGRIVLRTVSDNTLYEIEVTNKKINKKPIKAYRPSK